MNDNDEPIIRPNGKNKTYTKIFLRPDFTRFNITLIDEDVVYIMKKRVYDMEDVNSSLKILLNSSKINIKMFKE